MRVHQGDGPLRYSCAVNSGCDGWYHRGVTLLGTPADVPSRSHGTSSRRFAICQWQIGVAGFLTVVLFSMLATLRPDDSVERYMYTYTHQGTTSGSVALSTSLCNSTMHCVATYESVHPGIVQNILQLNGVIVPRSATSAELVDMCQQRFYQPETKTWLLEDPRLPQHERNNGSQTHLALKQLGLVAPVFPSELSYDYVLFIGATLSKVQQRLEFLTELWVDYGLRWRHLVFLGGSRKLGHSSEKDISWLCEESGICPRGVPETEIEMMVDLFNWYRRTGRLPNGMSSMIPDTPALQFSSGGGGKLLLAGNVMHAWLSQRTIEPGSALVLSSQPSTLRHFYHFSNHLPRILRVDAAGPAGPPFRQMAAWYMREVSQLTWEAHRFGKFSVGSL